MPKPITAPVAAEVRQDQDSEAALIRGAKEAVSDCAWKVGEFASRWTAAWARGRTDNDFGAAIGMTGDQVYQRRRVWDRFGGKTDIYRNLSWSHFYAALAWEDAESWLQWASDKQATVAEMKAWRTAKTAQEFLPPDGERDGDPFAGSEDPFGEGEEGAGTDAGGTEADGEEGGTDSDGTDSEEERPRRRRRKGTEEPAGEEPDPKEAFHNHKARTVKTIEALMRAIDDLKNMAPLPQHDSMIKGLQKMLATIKQVQ